MKDKKRDKKVKDGDLSWGGSCEGGEVSKHQGTLSLAGLWGVLESREQHTQEEGNTHTHTHTHTHTQNMRLTTTPGGEVAQKLASATSQRGLSREAWVACLG